MTDSPPIRSHLIDHFPFAADRRDPGSLFELVFYRIRRFRQRLDAEQARTAGDKQYPNCIAFPRCSLTSAVVTDRIQTESFLQRQRYGSDLRVSAIRDRFTAAAPVVCAVDVPVQHVKINVAEVIRELADRYPRRQRYRIFQ